MSETLVQAADLHRPYGHGTGYHQRARPGLVRGYLARPHRTRRCGIKGTWCL